MTNSKREYNEFIRANLPYGITYDSARYQYVTFNGKRFVTYLEAKWYIDYLTKFGGGPEDDIRNDLFGTSEEGVWFEANDATTLFTDVAGTTPVTAPGDAVALQLDKSQGLTLGPELFTDAIVVGGAVEVDGQFVFDAPNEVLTVFDSAALVANRTFIFSFNVVSGSGRIRFYAGNKFKEIDTSSGSGTVLVVSDGASDRLQVRSNTFVGTIDLPSVKELPGNHRTQATTAARPLYALHPVGGVRNLLEYTEEFDNAVWLTGGLSDLVPSLDAPSEGPSSSFVFTPTTSTSGSHTLRQNISISGGITQTVYAKASGYNFFALTFDNLASKAVRFDLSNGTVTSEGADVTGSIELIGDGWYRVSVTIETGCSSVSWYSLPTDGFTSFAGDGISGTLIAGAQLEEGSTATNYQRVGSFLDVSEEGKARRGRIWYNGTSHFMQTGTITPGTDKVQVFAGVRKLSDAAVKVFIEYSTNESVSQGAFVVAAPSADLDNYLFRSSGLAGSAYVSFSGAAPTTNILTALGDISGDSVILRVDGVQEAISTTDQGTGNYLAYPIYFGARAGTSLFFNGYEDTSIIRFGPNLDDSVIGKVESYVASKTPEETI